MVIACAAKNWNQTIWLTMCLPTSARREASTPPASPFICEAHTSTVKTASSARYASRRP